MKKEYLKGGTFLKKIGNAIKSFFLLIGRFIAMVTEDQLTVYAAQATFFIIVSSVPFIILVFELAKYVVDVDWLLSLVESRLTGDFGIYLTGVIEEIAERSGAYLLSFTVITIIWSASRGVNAVTRGIAGAYGVHLKENFLLDILRSLIYTVVFIIMIVLSLLGVVFAESIVRVASDKIPLLTMIFNIISDSGSIVITVLLTLFFALIFNMVAKKGRRFSKAEYKGLSNKLPRGYLAQLPGAAFSALGWVLFSYFFSLYLRYFPEVSYLYGSLATVMLLMLWCYFCMFILMMGAEVNKMVFNRWNIGKIRKDYVRNKKQRKLEMSREKAGHISCKRK